MEKLPLLFDLAGTFVFALSGALAGVKRKLDLFGVLVLSFAAANSGGIARDLLIGAVPPGAISDWRYLGMPLAAGLAFFAVSGSQKALNYATSLGMLTGIGGGMMRDVLLTEIPTVLRSELYAVAALAGAAVMVGGHLLHLPIMPVAIAGLAICFGIRVLAIRYGWQLPIAKAPDQQVSRPDNVKGAQDR